MNKKIIIVKYHCINHNNNNNKINFLNKHKNLRNIFYKYAVEKRISTWQLAQWFLKYQYLISLLHFITRTRMHLKDVVYTSIELNFPVWDLIKLLHENVVPLCFIKVNFIGLSKVVWKFVFNYF